MSKEKEPIINGIDVSECEFYNNYECNAYRHEYCEPEDNTKDMCKWHKNCYFKQLKRLEQENKEYAKLMLQQQEVSQKYWECIEKIKQAIGVLVETCNVYPLKTNLDKLITKINEVLNDRD